MPPIELIPRKSGMFLELLTMRSIVLKLQNPPTTEIEPCQAWPEDLHAVEGILQSTRDGDVVRVLFALETKSLQFHSTISPTR